MDLLGTVSKRHWNALSDPVMHEVRQITDFFGWTYELGQYFNGHVDRNTRKSKHELTNDLKRD